MPFGGEKSQFENRWQGGNIRRMGTDGGTTSDSSFFVSSNPQGIFQPCLPEGFFGGNDFMVSAISEISTWIGLREMLQETPNKNGGFLSHGGTPVYHPLIDGCSIINHPFWGTPILGNHHIIVKACFCFL